MLDWSNPAQVMQAIYWTCIIFLFFHGYSVGSKDA